MRINKLSNANNDEILKYIDNNCMSGGWIDTDRCYKCPYKIPIFDRPKEAKPFVCGLLIQSILNKKFEVEENENR
jgi:hypothetical protein